jgi:hypothetical protein
MDSTSNIMMFDQEYTKNNNNLPDNKSSSNVPICGGDGDGGDGDGAVAVTVDNNMLVHLPGDALEHILSMLALLPELNQLCATCRQMNMLVHAHATVLYATPSINLYKRCRNPKEGGLPGYLPWRSQSSPVKRQPQQQQRDSRNNSNKNNNNKQQPPFISAPPQPMTEDHMRQMLQNYPKVTSLHLYHLQHMGTHMFLPLNNDARERSSKDRGGLMSQPPRRTLVSLGLHGCRVVSDNCVLNLGMGTLLENQNTNTLREIAVTGTILASYAGFTRSLVTCSNQLTCVTLSGFRSLYDSDIDDMMQHHLLQVQSLCLSNDTQLTQPRINSNTLQHLNLAGCCRFESFRPPFGCPNLTSIDLSQTIIQDDTIDLVLRGAPNLEVMELRACQELNHLDISSIASTLVSSASALQHLDLKNCRYLATLKLQCPNLQTLAVSKHMQTRMYVLV